MGPSVKKAIGLGYVNLPFNKVDTEIYINIRGKLLKAVVVKTPFYKK
jgi:aminomethyltransferase